MMIYIVEGCGGDYEDSFSFETTIIGLENAKRYFASKIPEKTGYSVYLDLQYMELKAARVNPDGVVEAVGSPIQVWDAYEEGFC